MNVMHYFLLSGLGLVVTFGIPFCVGYWVGCAWHKWTGLWLFANIPFVHKAAVVCGLSLFVALLYGLASQWSLAQSIAYAFYLLGWGLLGHGGIHFARRRAGREN